MNEIVKICLRHGELTLNQVHKENNKSKKGFLYRCNQCKLDKDRRWKEAHRLQHRESAGRARKEARRLYREGLTDKKAKADIWREEDFKKDPEKHRNYGRNYKERHGAHKVTQDITNYFGLTHEEYVELFIKHNNVCAICKQKETRKSRTEGQICRLSVDHCHHCSEKGIKGIKNVRGLLCHSCNTGIGKFKDNIDLLKNVISYLEQHKCN